MKADITEYEAYVSDHMRYLAKHREFLEFSYLALSELEQRKYDYNHKVVLLNYGRMMFQLGHWHAMTGVDLAGSDHQYVNGHTLGRAEFRAEKKHELRIV